MTFQQLLEIENGLSFLDAVKLEFIDEPKVYYAFLDILIEFKAQSIDTLEVLLRVSTLFEAHPELIVGFNTFVPHSCKNLMLAIVQLTHQVIGNLPKGGVVQDTNYSLSQSHDNAISVTLDATTNRSLTASHIDIPSQHALPSHRDPHVCATADSDASLNKYKQAINFVKKIKHRFEAQPEIYKEFLVILHTYQNEQRSLMDGTGVHSENILTVTEVFTRLAKLFQNEYDLLQELRQYFPHVN